MKTRSFAVSCVALVLAGCAAGGNLRVYPTAGPIAAANPGVVLTGRTTGRGDDGDISFTLPDGATCKGLWFVTNGDRKNGSVRIDRGPPLADGTSPQTETRAVSGTGGGACSNGATFDMIFKANGIRGRALVEDSNGNVYTILY